MALPRDDGGCGRQPNAGGKRWRSSTHGTGGLAFDASKRARPQELNVLIALVAIVAAFELLGRVFIGDSFLFNTRDNVDAIFNQQRLEIIILQVSIVGIIAVGVTQVIITGGIDLSSGSVVGRDRDDCDELRAGQHLSACRLPGA